MFNRIKNNPYYRDRSIDVKVYDIIHVICFFGVLFSCILVDYFFDTKHEIIITFGIAVMFIVTFIEANRTNNFARATIIMSVLLNFFYFPLIFMSYGKFVFVIPMYFFFGIIYTVVSLDVKKALIWGSIDTVFYLAFIIANSSGIRTDTIKILENNNRSILYFAISAFCLVSACAGAAVRSKYILVKNEIASSNELKAQAMQVIIAKDMFLTNTSHEIRTPMNAIVGNVDLMLDLDMDKKSKENVYTILDACNALVSILDEMMNITQVEDDKFELFENDFDFRDIIVDVINMISVRILESNLEFFVDVDSNIPRFLYGDSSKIKQLFLISLNYAIKSMKDGSVRLKITYSNINDDETCIETSISFNSDRNCSFSLEDKETIRNFDANDNYYDSFSNPYGAIRLIEKMNGNISCALDDANNYDLKFRLIQRNVKEENIIICDDSDKYDVLIIEKNEEYSGYVIKALESIGVKYKSVDSRFNLERELIVHKFSHIFVAYERMNECESTLKNLASDSKIILISNIGESYDYINIDSVIIRPINAINIFGVLKHKKIGLVHNSLYSDDFSIPDIKILVVDDNYTNLNVASALLKKYDAQVFTASNGFDAVRLVTEKEIDLVFLDYMMPDLNGIDTLNMIRNLNDERFSKIPAVALSANVVSGAYEMFMHAGFDAFVPKPIDVSKIEKVLHDLLPSESFKLK